MAEAKTTKADERVELFVPRGNDDDPNLIISVNGVNFVLPRGKKSLVPTYIRDEYQRSQEAQMSADDNIDSMSAKAKF